MANKRKGNAAVPRAWGTAEKKFGESIKENLDVLLGHRGSALDRAVTFKDLLDSGALQLASGVTLSNFSGSSGDVEVPAQPGTEYEIPNQPYNLTATAGLELIILEWDLVGYLGHAYVEIFRHTSDSISDATLLARVPSLGGIFTDPVGESATFYYWVRAVNENNDLGPFNSSIGTSATTEASVNRILTTLSGSISESELTTALSTRIDDAETDIQNLTTTFGSTTSAAASAAAAAQSAINASNSASAAAQDAIDTAADVLSTAADALATAGDRQATAADVISTTADAATATQKAADALQSAQNAASDAAATAADVLLTAADVQSTNADALATAADVQSTGADVLATAADAQATAADVIAAANSAGAALASQGVATAQATAASNSAAAALASEGIATAQATAASNSAAAALVSENNASTSETNAAGSAASASTSSTVAAAAQSSAETARDAAIQSAVIIGQDSLVEPRDQWTGASQQTATTLIKDPIPTSEGTFVTNDSDFGSAWKFTQGNNYTIGPASPIHYEDGRVIEVHVEFKIHSDSQTNNNLTQVKVGVTVNNGTTRLQENAQRTLGSFDVADGVQTFTTWFYSSNAVVPANLPSGVGNHSITTQTSANYIYPHIRQNSSGNGLMTVGIFRVRDVTEVAEAMKKAEEASASAGAASTSASQASASETNAGQSASAASSSANAASTSAGNALASEQAAATSETNALGSANTATAQAGLAATSASNASASEGAALASEQAAATSEANALGSANTATAQAGLAATSASNASASEGAALASEQAAATSESNALGSANTASTQASLASTSASNASTSEANALASETAAATSATNAAGSASSASASSVLAANARKRVSLVDKGASNAGFEEGVVGQGVPSGWIVTAQNNLSNIGFVAAVDSNSEFASELSYGTISTSTFNTGHWLSLAKHFLVEPGTTIKVKSKVWLMDATGVSSSGNPSDPQWIGEDDVVVAFTYYDADGSEISSGYTRGAASKYADANNISTLAALQTAIAQTWFAYESETSTVPSNAEYAKIEIVGVDYNGNVVSNALWGDYTNFNGGNFMGRIDDCEFICTDGSLQEISEGPIDSAVSASAALTSEQAASASETNAGQSASAANSSALAASTSEGNASTSAGNAATSAGNAATSEGNAATSAANAAASESAAVVSETAAATSASNAAGSATTATTQAGLAATSASNASNSAGQAAISATNAATSESNASGSASSASTSSTLAASSANDAKAFQIQTQKQQRGMLAISERIAMVGSTYYIAVEEDDTPIYKNGSLLATMDRGQNTNNTFTLAVGDSLTSTKPFNATTSGNIPLASVANAGRWFGLHADRYLPYEVRIYPLADGEAYIRIEEAGTYSYSDFSSVTPVTLTANTMLYQTSVDHSGTGDDGNLAIHTTCDCLVWVKTTSGVDKQLVHPASESIFSRPLGADTMNVIGPNASASNNTITRKYASNGPWRHSENFDTFVWGNTIGDGAGTDGATHMPQESLGDEYIFPYHTMEDFYIASFEPNLNVKVFDRTNTEIFDIDIASAGAAHQAGDAAGRSGQSSSIGNTDGPFYFTGNQPFYLIVNMSEDEEPLLGYRRDMKQVGTAKGAAIASIHSASEASTSETNAGQSAQTATNQASAASTSAANALTSEQNASQSETNASGSASAAATSASNAATSENNASTSAGNAATSATQAATSASNAAGSASTAATSSTTAASAQAAAELAQEAAEEARDSVILQSLVADGGAEETDLLLRGTYGQNLTSEGWNTSQWETTSSEAYEGVQSATNISNGIFSDNFVDIYTTGIAQVEGESYTWAAWVKKDFNDDIYFVFNMHGGWATGHHRVTGNWEFVTGQGTVPNASASNKPVQLDMRGHDTSSSGNVYLDGLRIFRGLKQLDRTLTLGSSWQKVGVTENTGISDPDGGTSAYEFTGIDSGDYGFVSATSPVKAGETYEASFYVKDVVGTIQIRIARLSGGAFESSTFALPASTGVWTKVCVNHTFANDHNGARVDFIGHSGVSNGSLKLYNPQLRQVDMLPYDDTAKTASFKAVTSADAAITSAQQASASNTSAGQEAAAAAASALAASTSESNASASESSAASSATSASGSASTASSQATLAATARTAAETARDTAIDTAIVLGQDLMVEPYEQWTERGASNASTVTKPQINLLSNGSFVTNDSDFGNAYVFDNNVNFTIGPAFPMPYSDGRVIEVFCQYKVHDDGVSGAGQRTKLGVSIQNGTTMLQSNAQTGNLVRTVANGVIQRTAWFYSSAAVVPTSLPANVDGVSVGSYSAANAIYPHVRQTATTGYDGGQTIGTLRVRDVTEVAKALKEAEDAASSAGAALVSEQAASASQTAAGQSAATATSQAQAASTSASNASASESAAASSATNAAGSASTATTQANLASVSAGQAQNLSQGGYISTKTFESGDVGFWVASGSPPVAVVNVPSTHPLGRTKALRVQSRDAFCTRTDGVAFTSVDGNFQESAHGRTFRVTGYVYNDGSVDANFGLRSSNLANNNNSFPTGGAASSSQTGVWRQFSSEFTVSHSAGAQFAPFLQNNGYTANGDTLDSYWTDLDLVDITSEAEAEASAAAAAISESNATQSENNASGSASAALSSQTQAANSASAASGSASNAANSASQAAVSESNASGSATAAANSATTAATARSQLDLVDKGVSNAGFEADPLGEGIPSGWEADGSRGDFPNEIGMTSTVNASSSFGSTQSFGKTVSAANTGHWIRLSKYFVAQPSQIMNVEMDVFLDGTTASANNRAGNWIDEDDVFVIFNWYDADGSALSSTAVKSATSKYNNDNSGWVSGTSRAPISAWFTYDCDTATAPANTAYVRIDIILIDDQPESNWDSTADLLNYQTWANGGNFRGFIDDVQFKSSNGAVLEISKATLDAATSADAAATSASSAAASNTAAGQSASAAAGSELAASTSASNASTSESNAATSATNASGSASAAASSASLAASTQAASASRDFVPYFDPFVLGGGTNSSPTPGWRNASVKTGVTNPTTGSQAIAIVDGARQEPPYNFYSGQKIRVSFYYNSSAAIDNATVALRAGSQGTLYSPSFITIPHSSSGWVAVDQIITIPANLTNQCVAFDRITSTGDLLISDLSWIDVTESEAAADSASAALTSQQAAAVSETNAGTSASTASTQASNASTSAGNAATSASQAATSASNAAGSASSASSAQSLAVTARDAAIAARDSVVIQNLMPDSSFEAAGVAGGFLDNSGYDAEVGRFSVVSSGTGSISPHHGSYMIKLTSTGATDTFATIRTFDINVASGDKFTLGAWVYNNTGGDVDIAIAAQGGWAQLDTTSNNQWTFYHANGTASANYTSLTIDKRGQAVTSSTEFYIDEIVLVRGHHDLSTIPTDDLVATLELDTSNNASAAATSAASASASNTAAGQSASAANQSALDAATSESNASTSESNAATSESNAAGSASSASTQAGNASTSASQAAGSASAASTSASAAATSASNAASSAAAAALDLRLLEARVTSGLNGHYVSNDWYLRSIDGAGAPAYVSALVDGVNIYIEKMTDGTQYTVKENADAYTNYNIPSETSQSGVGPWRVFASGPIICKHADGVMGAPANFSSLLLANSGSRYNPYDIFLFAPFGEAQVDVYYDASGGADFTESQSTVDDTIIIPAGGYYKYEADVELSANDADATFVFKSDARITGIFRPTGGGDNMLMIPMSNGEVVSNSEAAGEIIFRANSKTSGTPTRITNGSAKYYAADDEDMYLAYYGHADGAGGDAEFGLPREALSDLYVWTEPDLSNYRIVAVEPCEVTVMKADGTVLYRHDLSAASTSAPVFVEQGSHSGNTNFDTGGGPYRFVGTAPFHIVAQEGGDDDETVLLGARQARLGDTSVQAIAKQVNTVSSTVDGNTASIQTQATSINGLEAQYTVKIDNAGHVSGYGLASTVVDGTPVAEFGVRADQFWVAPPAIASNSAPTTNLYPGKVWVDTSGSTDVTKYYTGGTWSTTPQNLPFVVQATPTTLNGESVPPGVYIDAAYIKNGSITSARIGDAAIDDAKISDLSATKLTAGTIDASNISISGTNSSALNISSASSGARTVYTSTGIQIFDANGLRVKIGQL